MRRLGDYATVVIKIGSSLLVDHQFQLRQTWLESLAADVADLVGQGTRVLLVSSGAIALGRSQITGTHDRFGSGQLELRESQAAASIGQISLSAAYKQAFAKHGRNASQILLTIDDTEQRRRYLNARATIETLLEWGAVPIINENDTVATSEIRYGDNDRLSARVASMIDANLLILLSDVDGLYSAPPTRDPDATLIDEVPRIDDRILAMAGDAATGISRGGMKTKIEAARIATEAGISLVIASGLQPHSIRQLAETGRGTWFKPHATSLTARKRWIAGGLNPSGQIVIDGGALLALQSGRSLLPAGVIKVEGAFKRGDTVTIVGPNGHSIGRGLIEYDLADTRAIIGKQTTEIRKMLGDNIRSELIHRDNLVVDNNECL